MSIEDDEFYVMTNSDEFRACETMAQQETPIKVAVSRLIDFYGMCEEDAHSYYMEALQKNRNRGGKRSKELQEMEQEELTAEPSLDKMIPELLSPKYREQAKAFFADVLAHKDEDEETDEDGIRAEALRRSKVRHDVQVAQTRALSRLQKNTPDETE